MANNNELSNVPRLNFFQNIRKRILLLRVNSKRYNNAPEYLKNDTSVIDALLQQSEYNVIYLSDENLYRVLEENPNLVMNLDNKKRDEIIPKMPKLIRQLDEGSKSRQLFDLKRYELFKELPIEEQIQLLTSDTEYRFYSDKKRINGWNNYLSYISDKNSLQGESGKFKIDPRFFSDKLDKFSEEAVLKAITKLKEQTENKNNRKILQEIKIDTLPVDLQLKIVNLDTNLTQKMSEEAAIKYVGNNPLLLNLVSKEAKKSIIRTHPELISSLDIKEQRDILKFDEKSKYLKFIPSKFRFRADDGYNKTLITNVEEGKKALVNANHLFLFDLSEATDWIQNKETLNEISKICPQIFGIPYIGTDKLKAIKKLEKVKDFYWNKIQDPKILEALKSSYYMSHEVYDHIEDRHKNVAIHKVLTNDMVMKNVDPEKIAQFIMTPTMEQLSEIVGITYGEEAKAILESRPQLELKHVPNLYIFDPKIREEFGNGMIHNMLSYEGKSPIVLADLVVNPEKMEQYKKFERITRGFFQDNVAGIEERFKAFKNHENIISQIDEKDLSEKRIYNLKLLLTDRNSPETYCINMESLDDLDNYDIERNKIYDDAIDKLSNLKELKDIISKKFFGMPYENQFDDNYKLSTLSLNAMIHCYNIDSFIKDRRTQESKLFNEEDIDQLEIASIINKVNDPNVLKQIYKALSEKENILGPVEFENIKQRIPEQYSKEILSNLLTVEKAKEMIESRDTGISIDKTEDGIEIINLHGADFKMMIHSMMLSLQTNSGLSIPFNTEKDELWKYFENGMSTISTCLIEPNILNSCGDSGEVINFGFSNSIDPRQIIGVSHHDAHTSHSPRNLEPDFEYDSVRFNYTDELLRKTAAQITGIEAKDFSHEYNEVAMYRREQQLDKINNENFGGKIMPDYIVVYGKANERHKELAKKFSKEGKPLPIVEIDTKVYEQYPFNKNTRANTRIDNSQERSESEIIGKIKNITRGEEYDER